ncbi:MULTISPECIES: cell division protein FtsL [Halomonas]|jgi:cell division protein FtsL|uniref:Cell division protein FtsL n=3 Tax=Halomonas TaxID=2745 RepID=A0AAU7KM54_9GAMM|nr:MULTISPECIES: cell division protein FtsL [Halomonas]MBR9769653.1 cell division protein FtsL [Gammaproteobacteria bacterium]KJZ11285.1 cell division protein FtsL [Halomonas sp. S2151]MAR70761.1 cell division protein FtsL [Halomonas sp.]MAY72250.1 cell division protein FtsL [Halomonas sp.]MBR9878864.1 cell division protein FtsL [Gammaproteobacteria bacterium]|tara:strand:+ start:251 stop:574 length:324 start_codon:yes stop_codon:yes gene_type:complete
MAQGRLDINAFGWPLPRTMSPRLLLVVALLLACLVSALAVISVSHQTRQQYARLQELEREQQQLQTEWGQLLLEESAWSTPSRVERLAVERLEMRLPDIHDIEVITP